jgi:hypothetical protein
VAETVIIIHPKEQVKSNRLDIAFGPEASFGVANNTENPFPLMGVLPDHH